MYSGRDGRGSNIPGQNVFEKQCEIIEERLKMEAAQKRSYIVTKKDWDERTQAFLELCKTDSNDNSYDKRSSDKRQRDEVDERLSKKRSTSGSISRPENMDSNDKEPADNPPTNQQPSLASADSPAANQRPDHSYTKDDPLDSLVIDTTNDGDLQLKLQKIINKEPEEGEVVVKYGNRWHPRPGFNFNSFWRRSVEDPKPVDYSKIKKIKIKKKVKKQDGGRESKLNKVWGAQATGQPPAWVPRVSVGKRAGGSGITPSATVSRPPEDPPAVARLREAALYYSTLSAEEITKQFGLGSTGALGKGKSSQAMYRSLAQSIYGFYEVPTDPFAKFKKAEPNPDEHLIELDVQPDSNGKVKINYNQLAKIMEDVRLKDNLRRVKMMRNPFMTSSLMGDEGGQESSQLDQFSRVMKKIESIERKLADRELYEQDDGPEVNHLTMSDMFQDIGKIRVMRDTWNYLREYRKEEFDHSDILNSLNQYKLIVPAAYHDVLKAPELEMEYVEDRDSDQAQEKLQADAELKELQQILLESVHPLTALVDCTDKWISEQPVKDKEDMVKLNAAEVSQAVSTSIRAVFDVVGSLTYHRLNRVRSLIVRRTTAGFDDFQFQPSNGLLLGPYPGLQVSQFESAQRMRDLWPERDDSDADPY